MQTPDAQFPSGPADPDFQWAAQTVLERAFGAAFDIAAASTAPRNTRHVPRIESLDDNRQAIALQFSDPAGLHWQATGIVPATDSKLLDALAETALTALDGVRQQFEHSDQLEDFIQQMGDSLEEVTWLRRLATRLPTCDASQSLADVCQAVLPPLRELIHAESIAVLASESPRNGEAAGASLWIGPAIVDLDRFREFIRTAASQSSDGALVFGPADSAALQGHGDRLRTGIAARLATPRSNYGWLVAVNRSASRAHARSGTHWSEAAPEFGSVEAGLLEATAIMLATHHRNAELFHEQERLTIGVIRTLINAIDAKDRYTRGHSDRVARMARRLAIELALSTTKCEQIYVTGLLHDVGKIGVPDYVLQKPGRLTPEEFDLIKQHPKIGYDIVRPLKQLSYTLPGVLHHHEAMDGRGYPDGLCGEQIPLEARILAVADAYDAMTSCRPYRNAMSFERAEMILQDNAGIQWDATVVAAFLAARSDMLAICRPASVADGPEPPRGETPSDYNLWAEFPWRSDSLAAALVGSAT